MYRRPIVLRAISAIPVACLFVFLDPFNIEKYSDRAGRDLVLGIVSPAIAKPPEDFVVALIDDEALMDRGASWPLPFAVHASLISAFHRLEPSAIFVDFAFIDDRGDPGLPRLEDAFRRAAGCVEPNSPAAVAPPTKLFLLVGSPEARALQEIVPGLSELERCENITFVSGLSTQSVRRGASYRMRPDTNGRPALATALYEQVFAGSMAEATDTEDMEVIWSEPVQDTDALAGAPDIQSIEANPVRRAVNVLTSGWAGPSAREPAARPTQQLYAAVTRDAFDLAIGDTRTASRALVGGKVLLYGQDLSLSGDRVETPVYNSVPGVQMHAMAAQNLKQFGANYIRADWRLAWPRWAVDLLMAAAMYLLLEILFLWSGRWSLPANRCLRLLGASGAFLVSWAAYVLAISLASLGFVFVLSMSPLVFGSLLWTSLAVRAIVRDIGRTQLHARWRQERMAKRTENANRAQKNISATG